MKFRIGDEVTLIRDGFTGVFWVVTKLETVGNTTYVHVDGNYEVAFEERAYKLYETEHVYNSPLNQALR